MQRALTQFMLDMHTQSHGYTEVYVPFIVNSDSLYGTGQLPKFAEDSFKLEGDSGYYLIPTAEVPVTNMLRDRIIEDERRTFPTHPAFPPDRLAAPTVPRARRPTSRATS